MVRNPSFACFLLLTPLIAEILIPKELDGDLEAFNEEDEDHSESWSDLGIDQMPHTDSSRTAAAKKMDKKDKPAIALPPQAFPQS